MHVFNAKVNASSPDAVAVQKRTHIPCRLRTEHSHHDKPAVPVHLCMYGHVCVRIENTRTLTETLPFALVFSHFTLCVVFVLSSVICDAFYDHTLCIFDCCLVGVEFFGFLRVVVAIT